MRYSAQHKAKTHERVLRKAAEQMCRRGVQGTGIASLMGEVGLTHGGFYAHFSDKNELIAEATGPMLEEGVAEVIAAAVAAPEGKKVRAIVDTYLSTQHRDSPQACPVAGLAGEMARQSESVQAREFYASAFEATPTQKGKNV